MIHMSSLPSVILTRTLITYTFIALLIFKVFKVQTFICVQELIYIYILYFPFFYKGFFEQSNTNMG